MNKKLITILILILIITTAVLINIFNNNYNTKIVTVDTNLTMSICAKKCVLGIVDKNFTSYDMVSNNKGYIEKNNKLVENTSTCTLKIKKEKKDNSYPIIKVISCEKE